MSYGYRVVEAELLPREREDGQRTSHDEEGRRAGRNPYEDLAAWLPP